MTKKHTTSRGTLHRTSPKHVILKWNPGDSFEPHTIEAHVELIANLSSVWWGKISKSKRLGIGKTDVELIQRQLRKGIETHLYLYCPDIPKPTVHVGLLKNLQTAWPDDKSRIPNYYFKTPYEIPFWFELEDIREVSLEVFHNLVARDGTAFDPVSSNVYPALVKERQERTLFDYSYTNGAKWSALQQLHLASQKSPLVDPSFVFVLMPFSSEFTDTWKLGIQPSIEGLGFTCRRADDILHARDVMDVVRENIHKATVIVADLTGNNPNVFYELGYAHALNKPVILISKDRTKVPFDLQSINSIEYHSIAELKKSLEAMLKAVMAV